MIREEAPQAAAPPRSIMVPQENFLKVFSVPFRGTQRASAQFMTENLFGKRSFRDSKGQEEWEREKHPSFGRPSWAECRGGIQKIKTTPCFIGAGHIHG